jgi:hypothetical protein
MKAVLLYAYGDPEYQTALRITRSSPNQRASTCRAERKFRRRGDI